MRFISPCTGSKTPNVTALGSKTPNVTALVTFIHEQCHNPNKWCLLHVYLLHHDKETPSRQRNHCNSDALAIRSLQNGINTTSIHPFMSTVHYFVLR